MSDVNQLSKPTPHSLAGLNHVKSPLFASFFTVAPLKSNGHHLFQSPLNPMKSSIPHGNHRFFTVVWLRRFHLGWEGGGWFHRPLWRQHRGGAHVCGWAKRWRRLKPMTKKKWKNIGVLMVLPVERQTIFPLFPIYGIWPFFFQT